MPEFLVTSCGGITSAHGPAVARRPAAAMDSACIASAFLEPDPEFEWNEERLASIRQALAEWAPDA